MERLNLNLLRSLAVLLESRNVTQSADQLCMTQSAMSKQLAQLRNYFDDKLLVRHGNDYLLTSLSQRLKPRLQTIINQLDNLRDDSGFNPRQCRRRLTFACTDYVANFIFPDVICSLSAQAPGIDLVYRQWQPEWLGNLGAMPIDYATTMASEIPEDLYGIHLGNDQPVLLMARQHPLNTLTDPDLPDLLKYSFIRITAGGDKDSFFDQYLQTCALQRRIAYEVPFYTSAFNVAAATDMLLIVPRHIAANAARVHQVQWRELPIESLPDHQYFLLWHSIHHNDAAHHWAREEIATVMRKSIFSPQGIH
ncbi:LysR family transcriptional regulator [Aliamphritea ceti]|uniref:LysR family transcriptional regulator n=1 Tax=Aliamphritea ceti TaxID=1524258 RepID=UPI0021C27B9A|nr:LysR family transcriptional regulator [Aliamphritea ceti]